MLALSLAAGTAVQLLSSSSVQAGAGDLFASDPTANVIRVYALDGSMRVFASNLHKPQGLTFDGFGNLYVADRDSGSIYRFEADGTRTTFASGLSSPIDVTFDGQELVVSEEGKNQLTLFDRTGAVVSSMSYPTPFGLAFEFPNLYFTDLSSVTKIGDNGTTTNTPIPHATGVAVDAAFNAFVSSNDGTALPTGTVYKVIDNPPPGATPAPFAQGLVSPNGLAFRPRRYSNNEAGVGDLFVAETQAGLISEYDMNGVRKVFATGGNPKFLSFELLLPGKLMNISTRLNVGTGDNVLIGGFIVGGTVPKTVLIRGLGPSLSTPGGPIANTLQDPVLDLHLPDGTVRTNDDWMNSPKRDEIEATGIPPTDPREAAMVQTLDPGTYTVILHGRNNGTGIGMVELYDLDADKTADTELANISTRGLVQTDDNVMIGGFIIDKRPDDVTPPPTPDTPLPARVLIRAIGPELAHADPPVPNPLMDPVLELHDANGTMIKMNDNWADTAEGEISATGIPPTDPREAAILANLMPGNYTAIVSGKDGSNGVALVEVYHLP